MKWYARDPHRALEGMVGLSLEDCGAYNLLLDHSYARDGDLPDDPRLIACMLRVHGNRWLAIRERLIAAGKMTVINGMVVLNGVDSTLDSAKNRLENRQKTVGKPSENRQKTVRKPSENLQKTVRKPSEKSEKSNEYNETGGLHARVLTNTNTDTNTNTNIKKLSTAKEAALDWGELEIKLRQAAGWQNETSPNLAVVGPIAALIDAGADLDRDVLPVVQAIASKARSRSSWKFFVDAIRESWQIRTGVIPGINGHRASLPSVSEDEWKKRLKNGRNSKQWQLSRYGPFPNFPGCLVPPHLVEPSDGLGWTEWRPEPGASSSFRV